MFGFATSPDARSHAIIASAAVIIILVSYFGVNYAKFHTFDGVPLKYYDIFAQNAAFRQVSGGRPLHLENVPNHSRELSGFPRFVAGPIPVDISFTRGSHLRGLTSDYLRRWILDVPG